MLEFYCIFQLSKQIIIFMVLEEQTYEASLKVWFIWGKNIEGKISSYIKQLRIHYCIYSIYYTFLNLSMYRISFCYVYFSFKMQYFKIISFTISVTISTVLQILTFFVAFLTVSLFFFPSTGFLYFHLYGHTVYILTLSENMYKLSDLHISFVLVALRSIIYNGVSL